MKKKSIIISLMMAAVLVFLAACGGGANALGFDDAFYDYEVTMYHVRSLTDINPNDAVYKAADIEADPSLGLHMVDEFKGKVLGEGTLINTVIRFNKDLSIKDNIQNFDLVTAGNKARFDSHLNTETGSIDGYVLHTLLKVELTERDATDVVETLIVFYKGRNAQNFMPKFSLRSSIYFTDKGPQEYSYVAKYSNSSVDYNITVHQGTDFAAKNGTLSGLSYPVFDNEQIPFAVRSIGNLGPNFTTNFNVPNLLDNTVHTYQLRTGGIREMLLSPEITFNGDVVTGKGQEGKWRLLESRLDISGTNNTGTPLAMWFLADNFSDRLDQKIEGASNYPFTKPTKHILAKVVHEVHNKGVIRATDMRLLSIVNEKP